MTLTSSGLGRLSQETAVTDRLNMSEHLGADVGTRQPRQFAAGGSSSGLTRTKSDLFPILCESDRTAGEIWLFRSPTCTTTPVVCNSTEET